MVLRSLIIGYGSIGARHESVLRQMGSPTAVLSQHAPDVACPCFASLAEALVQFTPAYVVVANRTSEHIGTLAALEAAGFRGSCLVEKPLAAHSPRGCAMPEFPVAVGYVLRFHPLVQMAANILDGHRLISMHAYVGQYLPEWRPGTDYRRCYSSWKAEGGGALRDLSHELDYIRFLGGRWLRMAAIGGHMSSLEGDSDDIYSVLMETEECPAVTCQLNYLDRNVRRDCTIQYDGGTLQLDFVNCRLTHNRTVTPTEISRDEMLTAMHAAAWQGLGSPLCTYAEALATVEQIAAAEQSSTEGTWICNKSQ